VDVSALHDDRVSFDAEPHPDAGVTVDEPVALRARSVRESCLVDATVHGWSVLDPVRAGTRGGSTGMISA
jgi:hypothetical protein